MKVFLLIVAGILFLALFQLPIGYYTFLRIMVTVGSILVIIAEFNKTSINQWVIVFGIIAILFNPLIPIHLHNKYNWVLIDIVSGLLFIIKALSGNNKQKEDRNNFFQHEDSSDDLPF